MGYWNATCALTNLPIHCGDPVIGLLIRVPYKAKVENMSGACYPNEAAWPVTLGFTGFYNDYGAIEEITKDIITKEIETRFKVEDAEKFICEVVERDEYYYSEDYSYWPEEPVKEDNKYTDGLGLWMCHKYAWDKLAEISVNRYLEDFSEYYKHVTTHEPIERYKAIGEFYFADIFQLSFSRCLGLRGGISESRDIRCYVTILNQLILVDKLPLGDPKLMSFVKSLCELSAIEDAISMLRRSWYPGGAKGGQFYGYAWHFTLMETMCDIIQARAAAMDSTLEDYKLNWNY